MTPISNRSLVQYRLLRSPTFHIFRTRNAQLFRKPPPLAAMLAGKEKEDISPGHVMGSLVELVGQESRMLAVTRITCVARYSVRFEKEASNCGRER